MNKSTFKINLCEAFEHLPNAPIVEAVIHWRAKSGKKLEPDVLLEKLKRKLPDYPNSHPQQEVRVGGELGPERTSIQQHQIWHGFRFETADKLHVAQFTRNGFVFSRLKPYEDWEKLEAEAQRLWKLYCELAEPTEVQRLGVRFINVINVAHPTQASDLLAIPPRSPEAMDLPFKGFMHQNTFDVPGHPYNLNVIQTIQPPTPPETEAFRLILDLDVYTIRSMGLDEISKRLPEMRWIKNKAFFTFLTAEAIESFREQRQ